MIGDIEAVGSDVVDCAVRLHEELGPGLLESAYAAFLAHELGSRGHFVEREKPVALTHHGVTVGCALQVDLLVDECVVVESKAVDRMPPVYARQVSTYLRFLDVPLGFLINFGAMRAKDGISRIVNYRSSRAGELHFTPARPRPPR